MSRPPTNKHVLPVLDTRLYEREAVGLSFAAGTRPVLDFSLNTNPLGPPGGSVEAARHVLAEANQYPDMHLSRLRAELAAHHGIAEDMLLFGCGLDEVIKLIAWGWTNEGGSVVLHVPTFPRYELECVSRGAVVHSIRSDPPWTTDIEGLALAIERTNAEMVFLCTPNNPTGATITRERIAHLAEAFPETQIVVDEAMAYPLDEGALPLASHLQNVAVLRTFSKYYGLAGVRIGYAVAHQRRLAALEAIRPPFNVTAAAAAAASAALRDPAFLRRSKNVFAQQRGAFEAAVADIGGLRLHGESSNMVVVELAERRSAQVVAALARQGLLVVDGRSFTGLEDRDTIRISLRREEDNAALAAALRTVL